MRESDSSLRMNLVSIQEAGWGGAVSLTALVSDFSRAFEENEKPN